MLELPTMLGNGHAREGWAGECAWQLFYRQLLSNSYFADSRDFPDLRFASPHYLGLYW